MINKLLDNCFLSEYNTVVNEVKEDNGLYWHAFKETIFFMEGGGMASDVGVINGHNVIRIKQEEGKQWHLLDTALAIKESAFMSINLHERFRKCQVHTTQHLISALIKNVYKVKTISHHVSDEENEIEFDFDNFTTKMASELMVLCNGLIRDDLEVSVSYPTRSEAEKHAPLEKLEHDELRVVRIGSLDYNLCGCMHVPSLRYIQMIFISGFEKTTRGYKIKYICGDQLLDCIRRRYSVLDEACHSLAVSHLYLNTGLNKVLSEQKEMIREVQNWKLKYLNGLADQLCENKTGIIFHEFDDLDARSLAQLAQICTAKYQISTVFLGKIDKKCHVVFATYKDSGADCRKPFQEIKDTFSLQGGGNNTLAQGGGEYTKALSDSIKLIQNF